MRSRYDRGGVWLVTLIPVRVENHSYRSVSSRFRVAFCHLAGLVVMSGWVTVWSCWVFDPGLEIDRSEHCCVIA